MIAAIHLFHRRYPRLEVAGLHLWGVAQMTHTPGRRRERLPITASLILELLAALVLALALARPQIDSVNQIGPPGRCPGRVGLDVRPTADSRGTM